jgi:predicted permease
VSLDVRLVVTTGAVCLISTLILGLFPALRLTSRRFLEPARSFHARSSSRALEAFAGAQVALSLPLIVGASLFSLSLWHARQVDFGLDSTRVAVVSINEEEIGSRTENHAAHRRIQERLRRLPQVQSAALVLIVPMINALAIGMEVPADPWTPGSNTLPYVNSVDPSYFDVMGMRFIAGRPFTDTENITGGRPVLVVNEAMARRFWPGKSAIGQCVIIHTEDSWTVGKSKSCTQVIGVVANAAMWPSLDRNWNTEPVYYVPLEQHPDFVSGRAVLVRTTGSPDSVLSLLRREAQATGAALPFIDVWAFDDVFQPALKPLRLGAVVFIAFGVLGLVIAAIGLAAVTAYGVARRTREFGIRLVLGAEPAMLVRQTLARSLVAVVLGLVAGTLLAYIGSRWMQSVLFGVAAADVRVSVAAGTLLAAVGAVAAYVSARRAGHVEPAAALRTE